MHSKIIPLILEIQIFSLPITPCQLLIGIFINSQIARSKGQKNVEFQRTDEEQQ